MKAFQLLPAVILQATASAPHFPVWNIMCCKAGCGLIVQKKTEGLCSGVSTQSKQQVLNFFPICFSHWCLSTMLSLTPSLLCLRCLLSFSYIYLFFFSLCVCDWCVFLGSVDDSTAVCARLSVQQISGLSPSHIPPSAQTA